METELVNEDIHFRELDKEIRAIQNKCAADGMLRSGNYLYMICDLLMRDAERYIEKAYDQFINVIKSGNLYQSTSPSAFSISNKY